MTWRIMPPIAHLKHSGMNHHPEAVAQGIEAAVSERVASRSTPGPAQDIDGCRIGVWPGSSQAIIIRIQVEVRDLPCNVGGPGQPPGQPSEFADTINGCSAKRMISAPDTYD